MRKFLILTIMFSLTTIFTPQALAVEAGGDLELLVSGVWLDDGSFESQISESLDLELFLPQIAGNEVRYAFSLNKPLQDLLENEDVSYFTKKLYLKHRFDDFHLTVGRQPVSWSFGSLLNPVDYTPGAVAMDEEHNSKYTDAVEAYIPVNWNSSLAVVTSFPGGFSTDSRKMKWGVRGRMGVKGYDLTLNYVQESQSSGQNGGNPFNNILSIIPGKRVGLTVKGDVGDLGVYTALGQYFGEGVESSNSYLLGVDYSYNLNYYTKINMQLEYLGIELNSIDPFLKTYLNLASEDNRLDLLTGSLSYPIDDFSSVSLMTMMSLDDSSMILMPAYQNTLPGNIDLTVNGSIFLGKENSLFAGSQMPQTSASVGLSYPF